VFIVHHPDRPHHRNVPDRDRDATIILRRLTLSPILPMKLVMMMTMIDILDLLNLLF
jgi:hypothetical protein